MRRPSPPGNAPGRPSDRSEAAGEWGTCRSSRSTPLEHFLTARWGLHTRAYGRTLYLSNWHPRWPLHRAELLHLDDELVTAGGLPTPTGPPVSVLYPPGVPVRFGSPTPVRT
ncbi:DUF2071 domain-containing protein [Micromonospora sp. WMMD987]|uniref:DUF2071 domain-containing protein n=1 Tax=Micromonospora sp. WMMD987 TaxID=3016089 RepID=UPI0032B3579F